MNLQVEQHTASPTGRKGGFPSRPAGVSISGITGMHMAKSYWEKLKDPRWQKKRLEALQKAEFLCQYCYDGTTTLHVHHKEYFKGREPWEYSVDQLAVLCENCHAVHHESDDLLKVVCSFLPMDGPHGREEAAALLAGWANLTEPNLADYHYPFLAGAVANLMSGFGPHIKIDDLIAIAKAASDDPYGMVKAMIAYATSSTDGRGS